VFCRVGKESWMLPSMMLLKMRLLTLLLLARLVVDAG
jgi:hypothetical protein